MELTISLAHFCDNHGPTSIICTQAQPIHCFSCDPSSASSSCDNLERAHQREASGRDQVKPARKDISFDFSDVNHSSTAYDSLAQTRSHQQKKAKEHEDPADSEEPGTTDPPRREDSFNFDDAHEHAPPSTSSPSPLHSSTQPAPLKCTSNIRQHRRRPTASADATNAGCTNCSLSLPASSMSRTSTPSPGPSSVTSPSQSSPSNFTSSPKLRSKFPVRVYDDPNDSGYSSSTSTSADTPSPARQLKPFASPVAHFHPANTSASSSFASTASSATAPSISITPNPTFSSMYAPSTSYHEHTLTYLSTHAPLRSRTYTSLRRAIVKTLSGETLPRGLTSGRVFFEDDAPVTTTDNRNPATHETHSHRAAPNDTSAAAATGSSCCIAYSFRLPDRFARGGGRMYAFVALVTSSGGGSSGTGPADIGRFVAAIWARFESMAEWLAGKVAGQARREEQIEEQEREDEEGKEALYGEITPSATTARNANSSADAGGPNDALPHSDVAAVSGSFLTSSRTGMGAYRSDGASTGGIDWTHGPGRSSAMGMKGSGGGPIMLKGRGLPDMTGDERVFAKVHMRFVELLSEVS